MLNKKINCFHLSTLLHTIRIHIHSHNGFLLSTYTYIHFRFHNVFCIRWTSFLRVPNWQSSAYRTVARLQRESSLRIFYCFVFGFFFFRKSVAIAGDIARVLKQQPQAWKWVARRVKQKGAKQQTTWIRHRQLKKF